VFWRLQYTFIFSYLFSVATFAESTVTLVSREDHNAKHAIRVIQLGLKKANFSHKLVVTPVVYSDDRLDKELTDGTIDIIWSATNTKKEAEFLPVRIPIFKGLLGFRICVLHEDNKNILANVNTLSDLKKFTFGQGRAWTDTDILRTNGFNVETGTYEGLFMMTDGKRFDIFPRGVHEPWAELAARPDLKLTIDENIMLVYKMPFYLFVNPKKPELAEALERGLMLAIDDGSFDEFFYNDPYIQNTLAAAKIKNRRVIELNNPNLPPKTPIDNPKLWIDIAKLK
jgi:hypothetical protein